MPTPASSLAHLRAGLAASGGRLYLGAGAGGRLAFASPQQALLVIGPPRAGKTSGVVVPNVLAAPGPVVATSTKPDVLQATLAARAGLGRCWLWDPSGAVAVAPGLPVSPLRWSPVVASRTWDDAVVTARALVGAARPGGRWGDGAHWTERAEALLAPLLHAAAVSVPGGDMRAVVRWTLRRDATTPAGLLAQAGPDAALAGDVLAGIAATDEREQSGIWSTAAGVLAAYRSPAALDAAASPNFDPAWLAGTMDTVFLCAPADRQQLVAPLVVAFLEQVKAGAYRAAGGIGPGRRPPVLLALDELANIAPLPDLPALVAEGGSQGVLTLACLQDLSQARTRWGEAADGFLTLFGAKLVLPGVADLRTLELISRLGGEVDVPHRSVSRNAGGGLRARRSTTRTWSTQRQRRLPTDAVNQLPPGQALLVEGRNPPALVDLRPWWVTPPFAPSPPATPASGRARRPRARSRSRRPGWEV
ncbi:MAG TPA: type IV secretory system conjugative DNA transfer family protein [Acidimicrobiales bacterium]|nr:type IV secretory system conjugative DNA transfer family protein [Acidimicrobiales bacterium]